MPFGWCAWHANPPVLDDTLALVQGDVKQGRPILRPLIACMGTGCGRRDWLISRPLDDMRGHCMVGTAWDTAWWEGPVLGPLHPCAHGCRL